jgi:hypothetical protein
MVKYLLFLVATIFCLRAETAYFPTTIVNQGTSPWVTTATQSGAPWDFNLTKVAGANITADLPTQDSFALPTRNAPQKIFRTTFSNTQAGVDSTYFTTIRTGTGQTVNQTGGNLVLTTGTTANAETILRSNQTFSGNFILKYTTLLSQRIVNQNFAVELVDVIGDGLTLTVNSATSITVTIPSNPFTAVNVGQSMYVGNITGVAAAIPGRYAIASVAGNNVTFTVAGWPASGSGTVSLFGWNYYQIIYNSTTATATTFDAQRRGWNSGFTTATINTTASPGHLGIISNEESVGAYIDQLVASSTTMPTLTRASRVQNIPDPNTSMYLQIRTLNGSVAPASTTTWTIGLTSIENYVSQNVVINNVKAQGFNTPLPVQVLNTHAVTVSSGTVTANAAAPINTTDRASAAATTTYTSAAIVPTTGQISYTINIATTAVSGTTPTMDCVVRESADSGVNYFDVYHFERITNTGNLVSPLMRITGNRLRYICTIAGTTPSFTFSIIRIGSQSQPSSGVRRYFDRSMNPNSLSSTSIVFNIESCAMASFIYSQSAAVTNPTLLLQYSEDGINWSDTSVTLTPTGAGNFYIPIPDKISKFARLFVSADGSGVTYNYTAYRCTVP